MRKNYINWVLVCLVGFSLIYYKLTLSRQDSKNFALVAKKNNIIISNSSELKSATNTENLNKNITFEKSDELQAQLISVDRYLNENKVIDQLKKENLDPSERQQYFDAIITKQNILQKLADLQIAESKALLAEIKK